MKKLLFLLVLTLATVTNPLSADTIPELKLRINRAHHMGIADELGFIPPHISEKIPGAIVFDGETITVAIAENGIPETDEDLTIGKRTVKEFTTHKEDDGRIWFYEIFTVDDDGSQNGLIHIQFTEDHGVIVTDPYYYPGKGICPGALLMYECEEVR